MKNHFSIPLLRNELRTSFNLFFLFFFGKGESMHLFYVWKNLIYTLMYMDNLRIPIIACLFISL